VSFVTIILCVASQRVFIVVSVYFFIDSVRKLLDTPSYVDLGVRVPYVMNVQSIFNLLDVSEWVPAPRTCRHVNMKGAGKETAVYTFSLFHFLRRFSSRSSITK
jgi:hypothetical protein